MPDLYRVYSADCVNYTHTKSDIISMNFHFHDGYEIYFLISGDVNYFAEKKVYPLKYGDLIITNDYEIHMPSFKSNKTYERIILQFSPEILKKFSTPQFNLKDCFVNRLLGERNKISLDKMQLEELLRYLSKMENASNSNSPGSEILKLTAFIDLAVFINRVFKSIEPADEYPNVPERLIPILDYIDSSLDGELSLELMENKFYINRFYLSRLFKKSTGINFHEYIICKRISKAKQLLFNGTRTMDACLMSGFSDYSNFVKTFKRTVGVTPSNYRKSLG